MIDQQSGISFESLLRGILGIVTVLAVAYALSQDRKRIDWKLIGGGLVMQIIFALAVLYIPFVGTALEWIGRAFIKLMDFTQDVFPDPFITSCYILFCVGITLLSLGYYSACSRSFFLGIAEVYEYFRSGRTGDFR